MSAHGPGFVAAVGPEAGAIVASSSPPKGDVARPHRGHVRLSSGYGPPHERQTGSLTSAGSYSLPASEIVSGARRARTGTFVRCHVTFGS
jgi:hypothetical protein